MRIDLLLRALCAEPWAIEPRTLAIGASILQRKLAGESFSGLDLHAELGIDHADKQAASPKSRARAKEAHIAVIQIFGVIEEHSGSLGTSARTIEAAFDEAMNSRQVDAVLFDVSSPGGIVTGVPELADKILAARGTKPTLAIATGMAASAAYWIASSAKEMWVQKSGETGSIGVWTMHIDESERLEKKGVKVTTMSAGKFKLEGAPWAPLDEEAQEFIQAQVDEVYAWFVRAVADNRGDEPANVRTGYGEGRVLGAKQSVKANLVDRVGTFDEAVGRLVELVGNPRRGKRVSALRNDMVLDNANGII